MHPKCLGLARTICKWCIYGNFGKGSTKYMVLYGVYIYGSGQPNKCETSGKLCAELYIKAVQMCRASFIPNVKRAVHDTEW
jgi:hypothetical protein